jgi:iron complex outermembrane receptor protein
MSKKEFRLKPTLLAAAVAGIVSANAAAQEAQSHAAPAEVVVTAMRVPTLAARTPVAMSVVCGDQLVLEGSDSPAQLGKRLPNLHLDQAAEGLRITIRGVTNADSTDKGDPSAAFLLDGVYIPRGPAQTFAFLDVDRIEVLRGPQGTLYGRNTTAGVINVISNTPGTRLEGSAGLEAGTHGSRKFNATINVPVSPALALRAAVAGQRHDSYLRNAQGTPYELGLDRDERSARLSARLAIGQDASLLLRYDHGRASENNDRFVPDTNFYDGVSAGAPAWRAGSTDARLTNAFRPPYAAPEQGYNEKRARGIGAQLEWKLGPATLTYLGSHRRFDQDMLVNYYYRVAPGFALGVHNLYTGKNRADSHELRVSTDTARSLSGQAGLYYFSEESHTTYGFRGLQPLGLPPYYVFPSGPTKADSRAAFGQLTWRVADRLRATAGARTTHDDKSRIGSTNFQLAATFNPATDLRMLNAAQISTSKTTWRLGLDADIGAGTLAWASIATGYKAGGFNDGCAAGSAALGIACPAAIAVPSATLFYQPETLRSIEIGSRSRFLDGRVSLNAVAFDYDYTNLQLSGVAILQGAPRFVTSNAGIASVKGLELDGTVQVLANGSLAWSLALLDAHYDAYVPDGVHSWAGRKLDRAPSQVATLGYEHRFAVAGGRLTAGAFARASSEYVIAVPSQGLTYRIPSHTSTDLRLLWQPQGAPWSVLARVRNLENTVRPIAIDSFGMTTPSDPRTVDVRIDYRF